MNKSSRFPVNYLAGPSSLAAGQKIQSFNFVPLSPLDSFSFPSLNIFNFLPCVWFLSSSHIIRAAGVRPSLPLRAFSSHCICGPSASLFTTESRRCPRTPLFLTPALFIIFIFSSFRETRGRWIQVHDFVLKCDLDSKDFL